MAETVLTTLTMSPPPAAPPRAAVPQTGTRRAPRPARPRAATTVSTAILTDRGLAEGYVALPLARLMAQRVWASIETLNQHLTVLERNSFTSITSDPTFEAQGRALQHLLRAYAALTAQVAALAQRLAQNWLTEADRLALATGTLFLLLPEAAPAPATTPPDPALGALCATGPEETPDAGPERAPEAAAAITAPPAAAEGLANLPVSTLVPHGATLEVP